MNLKSIKHNTSLFDFFWVVYNFCLFSVSFHLAGMLWSGGTPDVKLLENNITTYCTILQGFIFLCHGSTVGAGPTLFFSVRASAKQVIDRSISLLKDPILLSHGMHIHCHNIYFIF